MTDEELKILQESMLKDIVEEKNLETDIQNFANRAAGRLIESPNAQAVMEFQGKQYLLTARSLLKHNEILVQVRARPWIRTLLSKNGGTPDPLGHAKTASAIFEKECTMQEFVSKLIKTLFFNMYHLLPEPEVV